MFVLFVHEFRAVISMEGEWLKPGNFVEISGHIVSPKYRHGSASFIGSRECLI